MSQKGWIVIGLMWGDEGKGATVDFLARHLAREGEEPPLVVKSSVACQAEHNVVDSKTGFHHTFSQIGSGTLAGSPTHIASNCIYEPSSFLNELNHLKASPFNPEGQITISPMTLVTLPIHKEVNRGKAVERGTQTSTTGRGVWETKRLSLVSNELAIKVADLDDEEVLKEKIDNIRDFYGNEGWVTSRFIADEIKQLQQQFQDSGLVVVPDDRAIEGYENIIFEQAQGVLLDASYMNAFPYVTALQTTSRASSELACDLGVSIEEIYGCLRAYTTRHGAGPFPTELQEEVHPEAHNGTTKWAGRMRQGYFDAVIVNEALDHDLTQSQEGHRHGSVTAISLSHCDVDVPKKARKEDILNPVGELIECDPRDPVVVEDLLMGVPVKIKGEGPTAADRKFIE